MGKVNEANWSIVRLRKETTTKLRLIGAIFQQEYESGRGTDGNADGKEPSLDAIINVLISRDMAHRARGKRARKPVEEQTTESDSIPDETSDR